MSKVFIKTSNIMVENSEPPVEMDEEEMAEHCLMLS